MALVSYFGWEEVFVKEGRGFRWGLRFKRCIGFGCLVEDEKVRDWERDAK